MPYQEIVKPIASSRTLAYVFFLAMLVGGYSAIPAALEFTDWEVYNEMPSEFHGALSLVLGWLLVFRTNTAYSRWWEARTLWGALVNASRNLALKASRLGSLSAAERERTRTLIVAFPVALKCHLRDEIKSHLPADIKHLAGNVKHVPLALTGQLYALVALAKRQGRIDGDELRVLDSELLRLMDICGACERILKTRIVRSYRVFARQCVLIFLFTLPWGIAHDFRLWTILLSIIASYFMLGLETVAEHVEEPFGYDEDDLDLDSLCTTIELTVNEAFATVDNPTPT
jgi:putative membrane protein